MKAKNKIMAGVLGAVSVLALTAASSYAAVVCCGTSAAANGSTGGTVTAAGAGFLYTTGVITPSYRSVTLTCDAALGTWNGAARAFVIPATPDKDGILAAALTALAAEKNVAYCLSTEKDPVSGSTVNGYVKLLHVLNTP